MMNVLIAVFLTIFGLTGCTSLIPSPVSSGQKLSSLQQWNVEGTIGIRTPQENISAHLNWEQCRDHYIISLLGPLGMSGLVLKGNAHAVKLETSTGEHYSARNPETLLFQQTGVFIPVSNLRFWIRGIPAPQAALIKQYDSLHRLSMLSQNGWIIQFNHYNLKNNVYLPTQLILQRNNPMVVAKITISNWDTLSERCSDTQGF